MTDSEAEDLADRLVTVAEAGATGLALMLPPASLLALLLDKIETNRQRRQGELLTSTHNALERVKERIDNDFVRSDEFEGLVEEVIEKGSRRKELDKRDYYASLLASAAQPGRPDANDLDRMIDVLERLRPPHLWLLGALLRDYPSPPESYGMPSSFEQEFKRAVPGVDIDQVKRDWRELEATGLVAGYPSGTMTQDGARNFRSRVTEFGRRFHQFVILPYTDVHPPN